MSGGVTFTLDAESKKYLMKLAKAQKDTAKSLGEMDKKFEGFGKSVDKSLKGVDKAIESFSSAIGVGGIGVAAAVGFKAVSMLTSGVMNAGKEAAEARKKWDELTNTVNESSDRLMNLGVAAAASGIGFDDFSKAITTADQTIAKMKNGSGMDEYFKAIDGKIKRTTSDFIGMTTAQSVKVIIDDLDRIGLSARQKREVLKELGIDSENMKEVFSLGDAALASIVSEMPRAVNISKSTAENIAKMNTSMDTLGTNLKSNIVERLSDTYSWLKKIADVTSKGLADSTLEMQGQKALEALRSGGDMSKFSNEDLVAAQKLLEEAQKRGTDAIERNTKAIEGATKIQKHGSYFSDIHQNNSTLNNMGGYVSFGARAQNNGAEVSPTDQLSRDNKAIQNGIDKSKQEQESIDSILKKRDADAAASRKQQTDAERAAEAKRKAEQKLADDIARIRELSRYSAVKTEVKALEMSYELEMLSVEQRKEELKRLGIYDQVKEEMAFQHNQKLLQIELKAEQKMMDASIQFETDRKAKLEKEREAALKETERSYLTTVSDLVKSGDEEAWAMGMDMLKNREDLERKKADVAFEYNAKIKALELSGISDSRIRLIEQNNWELEELKKLHEQKLILQEEYDRGKEEREQAVRKAERELVQERLDDMTSLFSGMSNLAAQGSKQQRVMFALEKASTIASMSLKAYDAWANVDKDPSLPTTASKAIAKAKIIAEYGSKIGAASAVMIKGQFHDGSSYVEGTGSYYLQQGERVISQRDNRDLTDYLKANERSGGNQVTVGDLVIQGGSSMTDDEWQARLLQYRETVVNAVNLARSENPSYS